MGLWEGPDHAQPWGFKSPWASVGVLRAVSTARGGRGVLTHLSSPWPQ